MSALMVLVVMLGQVPTKVEVTLFPAAVQLNGMFTQTAGTFGTVSLRVREGVSLQVFGGGNWLARESKFNDELVQKSNLTAQKSNLLAWTWAVLAGLELEPLVGTLSVFGAETKFSLTLGAGIGGGGASIRLAGSPQREIYGDAGPRFMGMVSSGLRVTIGQHLVLRAEIRDVMFGTQVTTINGCDGFDVNNWDRSFWPNGTPAVTANACRGFKSSVEAQGASSALSKSVGGVAVNIGAYVGAGVVF